MLAMYELSRREERAQERDDADHVAIDKLAAKHRERLTDLVKVGDAPTVKMIDSAIGDKFVDDLWSKWIVGAVNGEDALADFVHDIIAEKAYALACCEYDGEAADAAEDKAAAANDLFHLAALGG